MWLVSEEIFAGTAWASSKADPLLLIGVFVYLFTCWMNTSSIWNQTLQQNEVFAILRQQVPWYNINIDTYLMSSPELGTFIKSFISNKNAKDMGTTRSVLLMKLWVQRIQRHAAQGHTSGWGCQDLHLTDQPALYPLNSQGPQCGHMSAPPRAACNHRDPAPPQICRPFEQAPQLFCVQLSQQTLDWTTGLWKSGPCLYSSPALTPRNTLESEKISIFFCFRGVATALSTVCSLLAMSEWRQWTKAEEEEAGMLRPWPRPASGYPLEEAQISPPVCDSIPSSTKWDTGTGSNYLMGRPEVTLKVKCNNNNNKKVKCNKDQNRLEQAKVFLALVVIYELLA